MKSSQLEFKQGLTSKNTILSEKKSEYNDPDAFAKYCLSLFQEDTDNNVANVLSTLSTQTQKMFLETWKKSTHIEIQLLYAYYTLPNYVRAIADRARYKKTLTQLDAISKLLKDHETTIPPHLHHALNCQIAIIKGEYDMAVTLLKKSTLHLNLSQCRFNWPMDFQYPNTNEYNQSSSTLSNIKLSYSNLSGAVFKNSSCYFTLGPWSWHDLRGVDFTGANLSNADFRECNLKGAEFKYANLKGARFDDATFCYYTEQQVKQFLSHTSLKNEYAPFKKYFKDVDSRSCCFWSFSPSIQEHCAAIYLIGAESKLEFQSRKNSFALDKLTEGFNKVLAVVENNFTEENKMTDKHIYNRRA